MVGLSSIDRSYAITRLFEELLRGGKSPSRSRSLVAATHRHTRRNFTIHRLPNIIGAHTLCSWTRSWRYPISVTISRTGRNGKHWRSR